MRRATLALAVLAVGVLTAALVRGPSPERAGAASHREAPLISLDPTADITDFFMFRSYEAGKQDNVVMIMNVIPAQEPSAGPNYYNFDPSVTYGFNVDNNQDGATDSRIEFKFENEIRGAVAALGFPLSFLGDVPPGSGAVVPPITALDGPGSEGFGLRQKYTVTMSSRATGGTNKRELASGLIAVPSNVGPRTMPNYAALAEQGVYNLAGGGRVFAGQRQDPFYIDLGGVFDTLDLRRMPPLLTAAEDANDGLNSFGIDMLGGYNVNTIAIEIPAAMVSDGARVIGAYANTTRPRATVTGSGGGQVQVQRLANPLVNELIIGTADKDEWNRTDPNGEEATVGYYLKPRLAAALQLVYGVPTGCTPFGTPECSPSPAANTDLTLGNLNRTDLVNILLKYAPTDANLSELLRLDLSVAPAPLAAQKRLTLFAGDMAGWPNGRRPRDDVTDVALRVIGGPNYIAGRAGDGVNADDAPLLDRFPFLALPADGRNYVSGTTQTPHQTPANPPAGGSGAAPPPPPASTPPSLGGTGTVKPPTANAPASRPAVQAKVVATRIIRTEAGRRVAVRVRSAASTARVRIVLRARNGRVLANVVRSVATNRLARVPNLRVARDAARVSVSVVS